MKITDLHIPCPSCPSSDAYCVYEDGHGFCYSCNYFKPADKELEAFVTDSFAYEYLGHRGIAKETFARYGVKTKVNAEGKPLADGFIYPNGAVKVRKLDKKQFYWEDNGKEASKAGLFGKDKFSSGSHKYVTVTEGEYDALSLYQVLHSPVVSVQSAASAGSDCVVDRDYLNGFERIYLAFDADDPGREAAANVAKLFDYNKVYYVKFTKRKDANEYLQKGEGEELRQIWWNSTTYRPDNVESTLAEFRAALSKSPGEGWKLYPSSKLNEMTYGIRTSESVLITARTGVGKTELMHAIEYAALKETDENVGAIYLEEPKGNHLKALAGIHLQRPVHLPDCGVSEHEISAAIDNLVGRDDRLHLYSHFGSDDPRILEDTVRFLVSARGCRLVLLDHLTMVVAGRKEEDERRALDYISTRLTTMTQELDFALIVASHVNANMQARGSMLIEGNCHIHIQLDRDPKDPDPQIRKTTNFFVNKNRPISMTGPAGSLIFDVDKRCYIDPANDNFPVDDVGVAA